MRTLILFLMCLDLVLADVSQSQVHDASQLASEARIQRLVREMIGENITLNFKEGGARGGKLLRCNGKEFVLDVDDKSEAYPSSTVRSITISPGMSEGFLVALSGLLLGGFGLGVTSLSFPGTSSTVDDVVAIVCTVLGGWIGYESFYQDVEIDLH